jgi:hypothetical protein
MSSFGQSSPLRYSNTVSLSAHAINISIGLSNAVHVLRVTDSRTSSLTPQFAAT